MGRVCRSLALGFAVAAVAALATAWPAGPAPAASSRDDQAQREIAAAFGALVKLPPVAGGGSLQGYDGPMRLALLQAGTRLVQGSDGRPTRVSERTGHATIVRPGEATVPLAITVTTKYPPPSYSVHYTAIALETLGRWQVSWTTMCLLVESADELCPPAPAHLRPGTLLPSGEMGGLSGPTALSSGIVNPGPLAIAPDGGVLVADHDRNQILEWKDGVVSVVAGDGLQGFTGDGGPAVDAELNYPGEIAVSEGTIYFVDSGNHRVRAISPAGTIETVAGNGSLSEAGDVGDGGPATEAPLNPIGLAVGPTGVLFIGSDSDIRQVEPDGIISTLVRGGPPAGVDVMADGTPTAFFPSSLALNGQGQLIVFSFSPKLLFSVSPAGTVTSLGDDYATALTTAPDGSVLVAQHGNGLDRVVGTSVEPLPPATVDVAGFRNYLVAEGVAEAADGTVYVDTELDGYSDATGLFAIADGAVRPVTIDTPAAATLPAVGGPGFPASAYPAAAPLEGAGTALTACPSMHGVVPFTRAAVATAQQLLGFWNTGYSYDLHASDRAWWPALLSGFVAEGGRQTVGRATPASDSLYADALEAACGRSLVKDSIDVLLGPSPYNFSYQHVFLLDRGGSPLVYFAAI